MPGSRPSSRPGRPRNCPGRRHRPCTATKRCLPSRNMRGWSPNTPAPKADRKAAGQSKTATLGKVAVGIPFMVDASVGGALLGMCLGVRVDHGGLIPQTSP
ncbi:hypothetical protein MPLA_1850040 [Mesorhizobium sp. ORS 3359]|nr:hypothetical protein MPLA_1850040 [Mesorhizobium sp. ORS 3359]